MRYEHAVLFCYLRVFVSALYTCVYKYIALSLLYPEIEILNSKTEQIHRFNISRKSLFFIYFLQFIINLLKYSYEYCLCIYSYNVYIFKLHNHLLYKKVLQNRKEDSKLFWKSLSNLFYIIPNKKSLLNLITIPNFTFGVILDKFLNVFSIFLY